MQFLIRRVININRSEKIDFSSVDSKVAFKNSQYTAMYFYVTSDNLIVVSDKTINNSDNFRLKCLSFSKISALLCVLYFLFLHFFL